MKCGEQSKVKMAVNGGDKIQSFTKQQPSFDENIAHAGILMGSPLPFSTPNGVSITENTDVCKESRTLGTDWAPNTQVLTLASRDMDGDFFTKDGSKSKMKSPAYGGLSDGDRISATRNEMVTLELIQKDWNLSQSNEETLRSKLDKILIQSPQSYKRKDKSEAFLDTRVMERMSKVEESRESIESCNRKSAKKYKYSSPSMSFVRQDSSFMNWISNMLKGPPNHAEEKQEQSLIMCMENQSSECKVGFQAIFQSLYSPNTTTTQDAGALSVQYQMENVSHELMGKLEQCGFADVGPSSIPLKPSSSFPDMEGNANINRRDLFNLACDADKDGGSFSGYSLGSPKSNSAEKKDFNFVLHERSICDIGDKGVRPKSLFVSKYSSKESSSVLKIDHHSHGEDKFHESLTNCVDILGDVGKESKCDTAEASLSIKSFKGPGNGKSVDKLDHNFPSLSKSSQAFSSFFARQLDALKHIIQLNEMNDPSGTAGICLFCGRRGHDLQDCAEITESEEKHLLGNIHAYNWAEESLGLCIKCFQHNHWAIACPNAPSRSPQSGGVNAHLTKDRESDQTATENKKSVQLYDENVYCTSPRRETNFSFNHKMCEVMILDNKILSNSDYGKCIASSSGKTTTTHNYANQEISAVPKLTFDAIKKLRLSRTDILKWKNNTDSSRLPLDGFFLRLRVGMLEEGVGGASYNVACISRTGRECTGSGSKDVIFVTVGGMQYSVKSRYVSNHDFLEDELMAWWGATLQGSGGAIPSVEHLRLKLEEKNKLGL